MAKKSFASLIPHPENASSSEPEVVIPSADVTVKENPVGHITPPDIGAHLTEMSLKGAFPLATLHEMLKEAKNRDLSTPTAIHIPYGVFEGDESRKGPIGVQGSVGPMGPQGAQGAQGYATIKPEYIAGLQMGPIDTPMDIVVLHLFKAYKKLKDMSKADPDSEVLYGMSQSLKEYINSLYTYAMSTSDNATRQTLSQIMQAQMNKGYMSE